MRTLCENEVHYEYEDDLQGDRSSLHRTDGAAWECHLSP